MKIGSQVDQARPDRAEDEAYHDGRSNDGDADSPNLMPEAPLDDGLNLAALRAKVPRVCGGGSRGPNRECDHVDHAQQRRSYQPLQRGVEGALGAVQLHGEGIIASVDG